MRINEIFATKAFPASTTSLLDLELLLAAALGQPRTFLYTHREYELSPEQEEKFQAWYQRRLHGEPIAYLLGKKEFWSLELAINKHVLIPRPATETLVEVVLQVSSEVVLEVADLGTGSGAIALALARERPKWNVVATDISARAIQMASHNAKQLQIPNVKFYSGDWCRALPRQELDVITSNPPYVAKSDPHLQAGDVSFEPRLALESGSDGLADIRAIIMQAKTKLRACGLLALEHGYDQKDAVQKLLKDNDYQEISSYQDLQGIYRVTVARRQ